MKIIVGVLLWIFICLGTTSCQKDFTITAVDSTLITPPAISGSFTATIDGVPFVANQITAAAKTMGVIAISGKSSDGQLIVLRVADSGVHVYSVDINSATNVGTYSKDSAYSYTTNQGNIAAESGGTLSITSIDTVNKKMSGTFSMKVYRQLDSKQKNITDGVFKNISYETTPLPPSNASDTFRVKADGTQFPVFSVSGISAYNMISLSASDQNVSKTVGLSFTSAITRGTYNFTLFGPDYIAQYNIGNSFLVGNSGTLTILEHNTITKRIRGTFNFHASEITGTKSAELTEGYFSVGYQ